MPRNPDWHQMHRDYRRYLSESPDVVKVKDGKFEVKWFSAAGALPFGYAADNKQMYIGSKGGTHGDIKNDLDFEPEDLRGDPDFLYPGSRHSFIYPGRIWPSLKIISFWEYPPKAKLKKVIGDINTALKGMYRLYPHERIYNTKIDDSWKLDIPSDTRTVQQLTSTGILSREDSIRISDIDMSYSYLYSLKSVFSGKPLKGIGSLWKDMGINMNTGENHVKPPVQKAMKNLNPRQQQQLWNYFKTLAAPTPADKALYAFMQNDMGWR